MSVVVLGMHRSGTSAATGVLYHMGLPLGRRTLISANEGNPAGHWESEALRDVNDEILTALGGSWAGPPPLVAGWEGDIRLRTVQDRAREVFTAEYPASPWLWKDPRLCITLPMWRKLLDVRPIVVFVHRDPREVAASLAARDGFSAVVSVALWERYSRAALQAMDGLTVLVTSYDRLLDDPSAWTEDVRRFLIDAGVPEKSLDRTAGGSAVNAALRRSTPDEHHEAMPSAVAHLEAILANLTGSHQRFSAPDLPPPTPWLDPLLAEHARSHAREVQLLDRVWRLEGRLRVTREEASHVVNIRLLKVKGRRLLDRLAADG